MKNGRWILLAIALAGSSAAACGGGDDDSGAGDGGGDKETDTALIEQELGELCDFDTSGGGGGDPTPGSASFRAEDCESKVCVAASATDAYCSARCDGDLKQLDCPSGFSCTGPLDLKVCEKN